MDRSGTVTIDELADVLQCTPRAVLYRADNESWPHEQGPRNIKLYYTDRLPAEIQERIMRRRYGIDDDSVEEMVSSNEIKVPPEKLKDPQVAMKIQMVCECLAVPQGARGRRERIRNIAESHGYNYATAYRLMDRVKKGKWLIKPTRNHGHSIESLGITVRAWDKEAAHMAIEEIMGNRRNHAEKLTLYERVRDRAEAEGLRCGCYESFLNLHKRISGAVLHYRDKGVRGLREDVVPAIQRDFTAYRAMECLVGDQHKADYYCFDWNGDVATLELFCWLDFRTQMIWGAVSYQHYNRYTVGQSLLNAVKWGLPSQVYTDWGKPEESNYVSLLIEQLTGLGVRAKGIRHTRAKVRHPQAKPIESFFGRLDRNLRNDGIPGYCKRLRDERESELQQKELDELIRTGGLLGIEEMVDRIFRVLEKWNDHAFVKRGEDTGKSPRQLYNESVAKYPVTTLSEDMTEYIFLPIQAANGNGHPMKVKRSQVKIRHEFFKRTLVYYSPELANHNGAEVFVRYNPFDPGRVWVFENKKRSWMPGQSGNGGRLICVAEEWGMVNPKNRDQVAARIEMQNRLVRQIQEKYRLWEPEKTRKTHIARLHPQEREARAYAQSWGPGGDGSETRVMKTPFDKGLPPLRAVGGSAYRPLSFDPAKEEQTYRPLPGPGK